MSLRFRYQHIRVGQMIVPLGGRTVRPRPLIDVSLIGPKDTRILQAILDTGADDTVFHESWAAKLGIDLSNAPVGLGNVATSGGTILLRYAPVTLRLTDGQERREWTAIVGFTSAPLIYPMLGFAGCLQFFDATFRGDIEIVELTPNALYPGT